MLGAGEVVCVCVGGGWEARITREIKQNGPADRTNTSIGWPPHLRMDTTDFQDMFAGL